MKKNICPYCDQVITGNYCKGCRRFVRKPIQWDVDYYLNERHPASETNCQYHGDLHTGQMTGQARSGGAGRGGQTGRTGQAGQQARQIQSKVNQQTRQNRQASSWQQTQTWQTSRSGAGKQKKSGKHSKILLIIVIYLVISLAATFYGIMKEAFSDVSHGIPETKPAVEWEPIIPEAATAEIEESLGEGELREEDVAAAGIPCNGYEHFNVFKDEVTTHFEEILSQQGFDDPEMEKYSFNQELHGNTWYSTTYEYTLLKDGEYQGYADINVDTGDGSLHGIELVGDSEEGILDAANAAVELLTNFGLLEWDEDGQTLYKSILADSKKDEDGDIAGQVFIGDVEVYCLLGEDGFCMMTFSKVLQ